MSSSRLMRKNSRQICGTNTTTPATPPTTPFTTRSWIAPGPISLLSPCPRKAKTSSIRAIGSVARAKMVKNNPDMTTAKTSNPITGCVNAASSRSVRVARVSAAAPPRDSHDCASWCAHRTMAPESSPARAAGAGEASVTASVSESSPSPVRAQMGTTGQPSSSLRRRSSIVSPRRRARSVMLSATTAGRPWLRHSSTNTRLRARFVASTTMSRQSGLGTLAVPASR